MNWKLPLAMVLTASLTGALWWREHGEVQRIQTELIAAKAQLSELEKLRAELGRLAAENQRLRAEAVDPSELARLRALGNDVRRLQGEKTELEKKLAAAEAARRRAEAEVAASASQPEPALPGELARGKVVVASGETILSGGWLMPDGRHGFAMITPTEVPQASGNRLVQVEVRLAVVSKDALKATGFDWFLTAGESPTALGSLQGVLLPDQLAIVLKALLGANGAELAGGGSVQMPYGMPKGEMPGFASGSLLLGFNPQPATENGVIELSYLIKGLAGSER